MFFCVYSLHLFGLFAYILLICTGGQNDARFLECTRICAGVSDHLVYVQLCGDS